MIPILQTLNMAMQALKDEGTKLKRVVTLHSERVSRFTAEIDVIGPRNEIDSYKETLNFSKFMNSYLNKQKMAQLLMKMMLILLMCRNRIYQSASIRK